MRPDIGKMRRIGLIPGLVAKSDLGGEGFKLARIVKIVNFGALVCLAFGLHFMIHK